MREVLIIAAALIEGAADGGADVLDLGLVGTEMVYYAVGELGLDGGVCVTASHNPKEYTGMKIVRAGALPVGGDSGLAEVRERALAGFGERRARGGGGGGDVWPAFRAKGLPVVALAAGIGTLAANGQDSTSPRGAASHSTEASPGATPTDALARRDERVREIVEGILDHPGIDAVSFVGSTPIGGPIVGFLGEQVSPRFALLIGGIAALGAAWYGWANLESRRTAAAAPAPRCRANPPARAVSPRVAERGHDVPDAFDWGLLR